MVATEDVDERIDDARFELRTREPRMYCDRLERGPRVLVRAVAGERVEDVGDGDDPSAERDVVGQRPDG